MKALVVFYSRTGHTRGLAQRIAAALGADIEEITDCVERRGARVPPDASGVRQGAARDIRED